MSQRLRIWLLWTADGDTRPERVLITYILAGLLPSSAVVTIYTLICLFLGKDYSSILILGVDVLMLGGLCVLFYFNRRSWWRPVSYALFSLLLFGASSDPAIFGVGGTLVVAVASIYNLHTSLLFAGAAIWIDSMIDTGFSFWHAIAYSIAGIIFSLLGYLSRRYYRQAGESEEKHRAILDNIEDGYFEVDLAGNFTFFNDSMCRMIGYSRDEMMGMNNRQYMDKEGAKRVFREFNTVYTTGKPATGFDWEIIRKDGAKTIVESPISLIKNSEGEPIGFRGIARDITERKRAERLLRALNQAAIAMEICLTREETFTTVGQELKRLGLSCAFLLTDERARAGSSPNTSATKPKRSRPPRSWWASKPRTSPYLSKL